MKSRSVVIGLAAFAAVVTANLVSAVCVQAVIALSVGGGTRPVLRLLVPVHACLTVLNVAVGWVAVTALIGASATYESVVKRLAMLAFPLSRIFWIALSMLARTWAS